MLSDVAAILSFVMVMMLIVGLAMIKLRKYRYQKPALATKLDPLDRHVTMILHMQDGVVVGVEQPPIPEPRLTLPTPWYKRFRVIVSFGLLFMVAVTLFVQSGLADGAIQTFSKTFSLLNNAQAVDVKTAAHFSGSASEHLMRISQLDPNQYASPQEYNTWAYSACSAASMTEVFDAYGYNYRVTDVLQVESRIGEITPSQGLLRPDGIQNTAAQFGFKTVWGNTWPLDQVLSYANRGNPVIVSFPPDRYAGGHILVVIGGNDTTVFLADTSLWNRHSLSRGQFLNWWEGFAAVVTPA